MDLIQEMMGNAKRWARNKKRHGGKYPKTVKNYKSHTRNNGKCGRNKPEMKSDTKQNDVKCTKTVQKDQSHTRNG